ncbi:MAG: cation:proton antiporter [Verrucomicrobia bacterium]|nr:cation:proton antiporter [Verrucomicrobiota bacterium]
MPHNVALISTIAVGLVYALAGGLLAMRLHLPPLVGYLLAGIAVGPFTPGFVADVHLAPQLAEIGVILLMFGVGMHFSLSDLLATRRIALPGALLQIAAATALGAGLAYLWGWDLGAGLVFGASLSVASTVVLLRALEARGSIHSENGRIAVGWLIVEDLITVLVLVLLPALAGTLGGNAPAGAAREGETNLALIVGVTLGKVAAFGVLMALAGARILRFVLSRVERTGSGELFTLAVAAIALGVAYGAAELFGVSFALGAFIAGMVVNSSDLSHRAARDLQPLQDAFGVLFFVAVGMLFDPGILLQQPGQVLAVVGVIIGGKALVAFGLVRAFGYPLGAALTIAASLAQIGEFSFILGELGRSLGLLPKEGLSLIVAGALISITLNPLGFAVASWLGRRAR